MKKSPGRNYQEELSVSDNFLVSVIFAGMPSKLKKSWSNPFEFQSMSIFCIHCNRQQETVSMPK